MYRRVLSVASCAANQGSNNASAPVLAPRPDVDLAEQRRLVAEERAEARAKQQRRDRGHSLYGVLAPQEEARVMEFNRHSLRQLVLEAHNRQVSQAQKIHDRHHEDPNANLQSDPQTQLQQRRPGSITPVPKGHFDLSNKPNFNALLQDIDTLMAAAQAKPPQTRDRILNQTYEELAKLSLWSNLQ